MPTERRLPARRAGPHPGSRPRKGGYAVAVAVSLTVLLGMSALAVDAAWIWLARSMTQDTADAAAQAGLFVLRRTGDTATARTTVETIVEKNPVAGEPADLELLEFGLWDEAARTFTPSATLPNAVKVRVSRRGERSISLFLARIFGRDDFEVAATAVAAARSLHACIAFDITNSWSHTNYHKAVQAALDFYDISAASPGPYDMMGLAVFTGRFAWEFSPMTNTVQDVSAGRPMRAKWAALETASKSGKYNANQSSAHCNIESGTRKDVFTATSSTNVGGCFPHMPREYQTDEAGTDHTTGLKMCQTMFSEQTNPSVYRALIVLTDGIPNGTLAIAGTRRAASLYTETRWREYFGPFQSTSTIKSQSVSLTRSMWETQRVHTWVVSFVQHDAFMPQMVQGDGYYVQATSASQLQPAFRSIANSMPMTLVQ